MRSLGKVQFGRIVLDRLNSHIVSPLRFAQGQALSPCASLRGNSAKGLSRAAARSFAALRMTRPDLAVDEELSSSFEPCLKSIISPLLVLAPKVVTALVSRRRGIALSLGCNDSPGENHFMRPQQVFARHLSTASLQRTHGGSDTNLAEMAARLL